MSTQDQIEKLELVDIDTKRILKIVANIEAKYHLMLAFNKEIEVEITQECDVCSHNNKLKLTWDDICIILDKVDRSNKNEVLEILLKREETEWKYTNK